MAVPSKNFTVIPDTAIDADSPITADLMEDIRDNDIHLEEWLGKDYVANQNHDHDGVNSAIAVGALNGIYKSADEVVNNSVTLQNDDELLFAVLANETYYFDMVLFLTAATQADFKYKIVLPSGGDIFFQNYTSDSPSKKDYDTAITVDGFGTATFASLHLKGMFVVGATGGNFQLQWAQDVLTVADNTVYEGSFLSYYRV